jgi:thymidylate kinase
MELIVVTGPDGSGKTTTCKRVVQHLESQLGSGSVIQVSIWDALMQSHIYTSKEQIVKYLGALDGFTRTLFIFHCLSRAVDLAKKKTPKFLLIEGYWYKYAVSEVGQGVAMEYVLGAAQGFQKAALTFFLDVSPEVAWLRKQQASQYEQGVQTSGSMQERFIQFQTTIGETWKSVENELGPWIHVATDAGAEEVANQIVSALLKKCEKHD